jgi:hypothetical protein
MSLISGVAAGPIDKENLAHSPLARNQKKRKARVSFANTDELLYFNTDDAAAGLGAQPPTPKKLATVSTPTRKRTSLTPIEPSLLENREDASKVLQSVQEETHDEEVHRVREEEIAKDALPMTDAAAVDASEASVSMSVHDKSASDSIMDHYEKEFTLEDALAENNADLDMAALTSAADDELSAIYASSSDVRASIIATSDLTMEEGKDQMDSLEVNDQLQTASNESQGEDPDSESHSWKSLMGSRRDSLSLPSLARRDSFSLNSTRHLRSHGPEPTTLANMLPQPQSRRQSLLMETTQSDLGAILSAQVEENEAPTEKSIHSEEVDPEETIRFTAPKPKSRRASLAMDMTHTDLGSIIMQEESTMTLSAAPRYRRQSMMDMTVTDLGSIALREEEPIEMDEEEAAHETIRMELTHTDLSEFLMADETVSVPAEVRVKFKNRRQSLAMEETQSNFGSILDAQHEAVTLSGLTQQLNEPNQDTSILNMSTLETAEERAAKPSSNLLSLLPTTTLPPKINSTGATSIEKLRSRRQSLAMDMTISNFGEILAEEPLEASMEIEAADTTEAIIESSENAADQEDDEEEAMEMTQNFTSAILASDEGIEVENSKSAAVEVSKIEEDQEEEAMDMTVSIASQIEIVEPETMSNKETSAPAQEEETEDDTMELPVHEGVVMVGEESNPVPAIMITAASELGLQTSFVATEPQTASEMAMEAEQQEDMLLDHAASTTATFPNLSISLSSRDGLRSIIEAAVAQSAANEKEKTNSKIQTLVAPTTPSAAQPMSNAYENMVSDPSPALESEEPMQMEVDEIEQTASSRRQSMSGSTRHSLLDNTSIGDVEEQEEMVEDTMSLTQMNNFLAEDTHKLVKRSMAKPVTNSFALLSSVAPGSPLLGSLHASLGSSQPPLLTALQNAIPSVVPRIVTEVSYHHVAPYVSGSGSSDENVRGLSENGGYSSSTMEIDNVDTESNDAAIVALRSSGAVSQFENEEASVAEDDDCMPSSGDDATTRLDMAQKQFEMHVEAQLRTPGIRKSLLAASSFTPYASTSAMIGSVSSNAMAMYPASGPMTMTMTSMAGTMTLSNLASTSFARFLANFGVNFLDGITNRRQSLGVRVPEPKSEYDRMLTKLKSTPELELTQRVFSGLNELLSECERRLIDLEAQCHDQCAEQVGVYNLFAQCITTHQDAARKDLALLKQVVQADAKLHLNQCYIGHYFEEQLYQTLQITLATAKAHLTQLEDQQTATITTKLAIAKQHSIAHTAHIGMPSAASQSSVTTQQLKDAQKEYRRLEASEDFLKTIQGWQVIDSTHTSKIFDYRNAVELKVEMQNGVEISGIELSSVMGAKTEEEDAERQLVEKMLTTIDMTGYLGSQSMFLVVSEVTTKLGRILDLANEIRQLYRSYFVESVDLVPGVGISLAVRFSNPENGVRYVSKLTIGAQYPFVEEMPVAVDARFGGVDMVQVAQIVDEEVEKHGYKLMTRVCKRLDRLCSVN